MAAITVSADYAVSPEQLWAVLEPVERHVDWMADAQAIHFETDQTRGEGTRFVCDTKIGPIKLRDRMEITEWEPPRRMGVRHDGVVTGTGAFELAPLDLDRRTRFTWTEDLRFPWYLGGRVGELLGGRWLLILIWNRNLRKLAKIVESQSDE